MSPGPSRVKIGTNEGGLSQSPPIFVFMDVFNGRKFEPANAWAFTDFCNWNKKHLSFQLFVQCIALDRGRCRQH